MTQPLKRGKKPATKRLMLHWRDVADMSELAQPPDDFGYDTSVVDWDILLNNRIGCCGPAMLWHGEMLWNAQMGHPIEVGDQQCLNLYEVFGYKPGPELTCPLSMVNSLPPNPTDQGTNLVDLVNHWYTIGVVDAQGNNHQIAGAAQLDARNWKQLWYASYYFDGVLIGVGMCDQWEQQFGVTDAQSICTWDAIRHPRNMSGHAILCAGWHHGLPQIVTWGQDNVRGTQKWYQQANDEVIAILSQERLANGVDQKGLSWTRLAQILNDLPSLV